MKEYNWMVELFKKHLSDITEERLFMERLATLKNYNVNDLLIIVRALCKLDTIEDKTKLFMARGELVSLYDKNANYYHNPSDYNEGVLNCTELGKRNEYNHLLFFIPDNNKELVRLLWTYKEQNCLKYVKSEDKGITISVADSQLDKFEQMITNIGFNLVRVERYNNTTNNTLIDYTTLSLPFKPFDYQIEDANKIVRLKRALLGHDMGVGKSLISILVGESIDTPKLVICPESLRLNWRKEILQANDKADVQILYSNEEYHSSKEWTITGYKTASKFVEQLKEFNCIFVDEAHNCKAVNNWGGASSQRAKNIIELAENAEYCYLLTGTPLPSRNKDLYNILKMLKCSAIDFTNKWAFKNYADKFCDPVVTNFGVDYSGSSNTDELHSLLQKVMIRRLKKDVLPNLKKQRLFIPIEPKLSAAYKDIEKRVYYPKDGDTYMGLAMTGRKLLGEFKIDAAIELADSMLNADRSVVIVTNFIETATKLKHHYGDKAVEIRGGMTDKKKQEAIDNFQSKKAPICILNMQAGGVGVTLTAAFNMIMLDYDWTPAINIQTEDRICRTGQDECCNIYYIYCENSIFDNIFVRLISRKSAIISEVVDAEENAYNLESIKEENSTFIDELKSEIKNNKPKTTRSKKTANE